MKNSLVQKAFLAVSEPDATPGDHYCIGPNCPKCRRRNRTVSRSDHSQTPNHYCQGNGCPKCNSPPNTNSLSMSLPNYAFRSVTTHGDSDSPLFAGPAHYSGSEINPVTSAGTSIYNAF